MIMSIRHIPSQTNPIQWDRELKGTYIFIVSKTFFPTIIFLKK